MLWYSSQRVSRRVHVLPFRAEAYCRDALHSARSCERVGLNESSSVRTKPRQAGANASTVRAPPARFPLHPLGIRTGLIFGPAILG
jgi:hypothetical protein